VPAQTLREAGEGRDGRGGMAGGGEGRDGMAEGLEMGRKKNGKGREGRKGEGQGLGQAPKYFGLGWPMFTLCINREGLLGSRVVSVLDSSAERPGFKSQSLRCWVTVLGKLFTPIVPLFTKQQNW